MSFARSRNHYPLRTAKLVCAFAIALLLPGWIRSERLPVKTYTVADGALRDNVYRIRKDSRGFLWLCSAEGISFFDGYKFTNFTPADGLPSRHVNDFLHSRKGNYWIATNSGLALLNPKGSRDSVENPLFTVYLPPDSTSTRVTVLHEDDEGMWVGTGDGLFRFDETGTFTRVDLRPPVGGSLYITALLRDRRGPLWIALESHGLFRLLPSGEVEHFGIADGLPTESAAALMQDRTGRIWVGLSFTGARLCRLVGDIKKGERIVEKQFERSDAVDGYWVLTIFQANDGQIWVGTPGGGLCRVGEDDELHCDRHKTANNICDTQIWTITEDVDGNLWLGTQCGTKRWARYGFTSFLVGDGLAHPSVSSMFENSAGEFFISFGLAKMPLARLNGERFEPVPPNLPSNVAAGWGWKQVVHPDRQNNWWFATASGLYRFSDVARADDLSAAFPRAVDTGARSSEIFRLFEDSRGDIWIQTYGQHNELRRWERSSDKWYNHTEQAGISPWRMATAFLEDTHGNLWIATGGDRDEAALIRYRENRFDTFTRQHSEYIDGWLRDLYLDPSGTLWIASNASGVLRLTDTNTQVPTFIRFSAREGLSTNAVYSVTGDRFGRIYVGSGRGIDRIDPVSEQVENFSTADGLPSAEVWTAYADSKGHLWFATTQGLARYAPEPPRERQPPSVFISGFRVLGEPRPVSVFGEGQLPPVELGSDQRQVTIDFFGLGSTIGERLRYEYRMPGTDWSTAEGNTINFANLSPGDYTFEVRAVSADRLTSGPASAVFRIAAPVWQQWWFLLLASIVVVAVVYMVYRSRLARLLELERTRTRIATDLHDDIGSNLSKISLLSEIVSMQIENAKPESERMLTSIAEISRSSIDSMRDIVWSINPSRDSVLEMTRKMREHAEDTCVPRDILVEFEPDTTFSDIKLSMETRREMFLIFKEAVNNAARHSGCTKLSIDLEASGHDIRLTIADDGHGFDPIAISEGNGLLNMKTRAEKMHGQFQIKSDETGTSICVRMPI